MVVNDYIRYQSVLWNINELNVENRPWWPSQSALKLKYSGRLGPRFELGGLNSAWGKNYTVSLYSHFAPAINTCCYTYYWTVIGGYIAIPPKNEMPIKSMWGKGVKCRYSEHKWTREVDHPSTYTHLIYWIFKDFPCLN